MTRYLLDTNTVSYLIKGNATVARRLVDTPMVSLCISSVTEGELRFGLAKRPHAKRLHILVREFLLRIDVLSWESTTAEHYGTMRALLEQKGRTLAPLDMLIAAHALAVDAVLVTNDQSFGRVPDLRVEDWTK